MATQTIARLIIATAALALSALLLFSERIVPAAKADKPAPKGDRIAPTAPTGLMVTAITENTVSLRWNASTDNSGKFSYRVKVTWLHIPGNTEHFVFQTQTTHTVQSLAAFGNYSFSVYAVDGIARATAMRLPPTLLGIPFHRVLRPCRLRRLHRLRCS